MTPPISIILYNSLFRKKDSFDCDVIYTKYIQCLVHENINCEKIHNQFEKCLYFNPPNNH